MLTMTTPMVSISLSRRVASARMRSPVSVRALGRRQFNLLVSVYPFYLKLTRRIALISRRHFIAGASASVAALGVAEARAAEAVKGAAHGSSQDAGHSAAGGVSRYVDLSVGTGGHGHTYPGATVPFGMVQVSPDTFNDGWDHCSGYTKPTNC